MNVRCEDTTGPGCCIVVEFTLGSLHGYNLLAEALVWSTLLNICQVDTVPTLNGFSLVAPLTH